MLSSGCITAAGDLNEVLCISRRPCLNICRFFCSWLAEACFVHKVRAMSSSRLFKDVLEYLFLMLYPEVAMFQVWRYYLLSNRPEVSDTDFKWTDMRARLNNELLANLGNFVNRALAFTANK